MNRTISPRIWVPICSVALLIVVLLTWWVWMAKPQAVSPQEKYDPLDHSIETQPGTSR